MVCISPRPGPQGPRQAPTHPHRSGQVGAENVLPLTRHQCAHSLSTQGASRGLWFHQDSIPSQVWEA